MLTMWIARSDSGELCLFKLKPKESDGEWIAQDDNWIELGITTFRNVRFNNSPQRVELTINRRWKSKRK